MQGLIIGGKIDLIDQAEFIDIYRDLGVIDRFEHFDSLLDDRELIRGLKIIITFHREKEALEQNRKIDDSAMERGGEIV